MSSFRRPARGLSVAVVLAAVVAAVGRWLAASASPSAFKIQNHERVTRDALTPVGVDSAALGQILVGPPPGAGAVGSDAFFADDLYHADRHQACW
jgi:hypothetical protein